jgi:hypothetical protein
MGVDVGIVRDRNTIAQTDATAIIEEDGAALERHLTALAELELDRAA